MNNIGSIIVWGDSLARGVVYDGTTGKYRVLEDNAVSLTAKATGMEMINRAKMGLTAVKGSSIMERDITGFTPGAQRPGAALIEFGGNDSDFNWREISEQPDTVHLSRTVPAEFERTMRAMVQQARDAGILPVLTTLPPIDAQRYFDFISRGLSKENILRWLGDVHHIYRYHEQYSLIIDRIARETGCVLLDLRSAFLSRGDMLGLYCEDGIHPNANGHKLMLDAAMELLGRRIACPSV